ncbi:MAG: type II and III secretion system protein [Betaproteobacteria bacterium]|nr:type II and III secretion system protein [Betaproteobacteria bacterium]
MPVAKPDNHIASDEKSIRKAQGATSQTIPPPVKQVALPPPPQPKAAELKYSVVVNEVPIREVLFAIAKETKLNIDIHPGVEGKVTLNAVDQSVRQILNRIARMTNVRVEEDGTNISIVPDTPFLKFYKVDYVNMSRETTGSFGLQSLITGSTSGGSGGSSPSTSDGNSSSLTVRNSARNEFWKTLEKNIRDIIVEEDKLIIRSVAAQQSRATPNSTAASTTASPAPAATGTPAASAQSGGNVSAAAQQANAAATQQLADLREANPVIVSPETGSISVRATAKQHEKIAQFLESATGSAKRQVLIEATVVEVELSDGYQSGVDWSAVGLDGLGYTVRQVLQPPGTGLTNQFFTLQYSNPNAAAGGSISSAIKMLSTFGNTRVLSSPKIMTLNNQTAVLKVVSNEVYFEVRATRREATPTSPAFTDFTTEQRVVPVGFVMSVTPQISEGDVVVLNIRPNVSEKIGETIDPNPLLLRQNLVPIIQTREFETFLRIPSGQTAILGGLMKDKAKLSRGGIPILSRVPIIGDAVSFRADEVTKSELVIFIRPVVIRDANVETDLADYRRLLPDGAFFRETQPLVPELSPPFSMKPNPVVPDAASPRP